MLISLFGLRVTNTTRLLLNSHPNKRGAGQTLDHFRNQNSGTTKDGVMRFRDFS